MKIKSLISVGVATAALLTGQAKCAVPEAGAESVRVTSAEVLQRYGDERFYEANPILLARFSPNGQQLVVATADRNQTPRLDFWSLDGTLMYFLPVAAADMVYGPEGNTIFVLTETGLLRAYDLPSLKIVNETQVFTGLKGAKRYEDCVLELAPNRRLALIDYKSGLRLFEQDTLSVVSTRSLPDFTYAVISPDGSRFLLYNPDGIADTSSNAQAVVYDVNTGNGIYAFPKDALKERKTCRFAFSHDGSLLACSKQLDLWLLNLRTGQKATLMQEKPLLPVRSLGADDTCILTFQEYINDIIFLPDDRHLLVNRTNCTGLFDLMSSNEVKQLYIDNSTGVVIGTDGKKAVVLGSDNSGRVRLLDLPSLNPQWSAIGNGGSSAVLQDASSLSFTIGIEGHRACRMRLGLTRAERTGPDVSKAFDTKPQPAPGLKFAAHPDDAMASNSDTNGLTCRVPVAKRRMKVLLVAGEPTPEYRALLASLEKNIGLDVTRFLQSADTNTVSMEDKTLIGELPEADNKWTKYDALVFHDLRPDGLTEGQIRTIENFACSGGGILFVIGKVHVLASWTKTARGRNLLPVEMDRAAKVEDVSTGPLCLKRTQWGDIYQKILSSSLNQTNDLWVSFAGEKISWMCPQIEPRHMAISLLSRETTNAAE